MPRKRERLALVEDRQPGLGGPRRSRESLRFQQMGQPIADEGWSGLGLSKSSDLGIVRGRPRIRLAVNSRPARSSILLDVFGQTGHARCNAIISCTGERTGCIYEPVLRRPRQAETLRRAAGFFLLTGTSALVRKTESTLKSLLARRQTRTASLYSRPLSLRRRLHD